MKEQTMIPRLGKERRLTIASSGWPEVVLSSRGGSMVRAVPLGSTNILRDVPADLPHGRASGGFPTTLFGRTAGGILLIGDAERRLVYPEDVDVQQFDPDGLVNHGTQFLYNHEVAAGGPESVTFVLDGARLPEAYPFRHSMRTTYSVQGEDLRQEITAFDPLEEGPANPCSHSFQRWSLTGDLAHGPTLEAALTGRYEVDDLQCPIPKGPLVNLDGWGPFEQGAELPNNLDNSYMAAATMYSLTWPGGPTIDISDFPPVQDANYVHLWTTGWEKNMFGVMCAGPANLIWQVKHGNVPAQHLPILKKGMEITRTVIWRRRAA
jgi:galactose mutarotase-like enzyme